MIICIYIYMGLYDYGSIWLEIGNMEFGKGF